MITAGRAISDPKLLGAAFAGDSWATWRAILAAAEGLPLEEAELERFRAVAGREPPGQRVKELWCIAGRRSGKDSVASAIAAAAALGDYRDRLRPGERASVLCLAVDRVQARIVHRYVAAYFAGNKLLRPLVERETDDGLELSNGVEVVIATNSFRSVRGRTIICAIFDEVAFWRDESASNPDFEIYAAVMPGLVTLPGALLIGISTPYRRSGLLFDRWRRFYGKPDPEVLVVRGPTSVFNPTVPSAVIDQAIERDPDAAASEWLAEWRSDLADFVDRAVVESAVMPGRHELPPVVGQRYRSFVDPSGGSADAMTLAIGHVEADCAVIDCLREVRPPFSPAAVVAEFAAVLRSYGLDRVTGDRYGGQWPAERFGEHGIQYEPSARAKNEIYIDFLPLLNSGRTELLDNPRLVNQLCGLERRTSRGGRDSIDHPPGGHDDLANAAAGCAVLLVPSQRMASEGIYRLYERQYHEMQRHLAPEGPALVSGGDSPVTMAAEGGRPTAIPPRARCPHGTLLTEGCRACLAAGAYGLASNFLSEFR